MVSVDIRKKNIKQSKNKTHQLVVLGLVDDVHFLVLDREAEFTNKATANCSDRVSLVVGRPERRDERQVDNSKHDRQLVLSPVL